MTSSEIAESKDWSFCDSDQDWPVAPHGACTVWHLLQPHNRRQPSLEFFVASSASYSQASHCFAYFMRIGSVGPALHFLSPSPPNSILSLLYILLCHLCKPGITVSPPFLTHPVLQCSALCSLPPRPLLVLHHGDWITSAFSSVTPVGVQCVVL